MQKYFEEEPFSRRILCLIGVLCIQFVIGTVYISGNISIYIASYLLAHGKEITLNDVNIIMPLQGIGISLMIYFGVFLTNKVNSWM